MNADRSRSRASSLLLGALVVLLAGCGSTGSGPQSGSGFVFLSVDGFSRNGTFVASVNSSLEDVSDPTLVCVTLRNNPKNPTVPVATPTALDDVLISDYTVAFSPLDRGVPPGPFAFRTAVRVPAGTTDNTARFPIILVTAQAKGEPPLRPLQRPFTTTATVLFRGRDGRGQPHEVQGSLTVVFRNEGDEPETPNCGGP